ncbi:MAG TPA: hypothetical protein QGF35_02055 [Dehalococcoidia bacterium]|nr:hypothetical protein [Dehalococcoidia bacterium]
MTAVAVALVVACGDGDSPLAPTQSVATVTPESAGPTATSPPIPTPVVESSTGGLAGGPEPFLIGPASRYSAGEEDLLGYFRVDSTAPVVSNEEIYAAIGPFGDEDDGLGMINGWSYLDGYLVGYDPEGLLSSVVVGNYFLTVETHLFESLDGAAEAYDQYVKYYEENPAVDIQEVAPLGNDSSGWRAVGDELGNTGIEAVYHRFVFRRGNLIGQVETLGGVPFMTIDPAREVAIIIDERALGERPAPIPTLSDLPGQDNAQGQ